MTSKRRSLRDSRARQRRCLEACDRSRTGRRPSRAQAGQRSWPSNTAGCCSRKTRPPCAGNRRTIGSHRRSDCSAVYRTIPSAPPAPLTYAAARRRRAQNHPRTISTSVWCSVYRLGKHYTTIYRPGKVNVWTACMLVSFGGAKLQKDCASDRDRQRRYGAERSKKIKLRLDQLAAAANLAEMCVLPQARCHQLSGDRHEQFSLDLDGPYRLIIEIDNDPVPRQDDGGINLSAVDAVRVVEVADTH